MAWSDFGGGKNPQPTVKLQSPIKLQSPLKKVVPPKPRKTRSDKRVRSTLRISREMDEHIKAIAYNHSTSKQQVIDRILKMVLESEQLRDKLIDSMPRGSQKYTYFVGEGLFRK